MKIPKRTTTTVLVLCLVRILQTGLWLQKNPPPHHHQIFALQTQVMKSAPQVGKLSLVFFIKKKKLIFCSFEIALIYDLLNGFSFILNSSPSFTWLNLTTNISSTFLNIQIITILFCLNYSKPALLVDLDNTNCIFCQRVTPPPKKGVLGIDAKLHCKTVGFIMTQGNKYSWKYIQYVYVPALNVEFCKVWTHLFDAITLRSDDE